MYTIYQLKYIFDGKKQMTAEIMANSPQEAVAELKVGLKGLANNIEVIGTYTMSKEEYENG